VVKNFIPKQGDIIMLDFDPQSGHEQKGKRPALVVSNEVFNLGTRLAMVCPITSKEKNYPFHIPLEVGKKIHGFVMVEHIKSVDYGSRQARFVETASQEFMENVKAMLDVCL
jgi:mRNA interferase MazF